MTSESSLVTYKCKHCSEDLYTSDRQDTLLIHVQLNRLPKWIRAKAMECSWTKGKLHCPECGFRVGKMNFVQDSNLCVCLLRNRTEASSPPVSGEKLQVVCRDVSGECRDSSDCNNGSSEQLYLNLSDDESESSDISTPPPLQDSPLLTSRQALKSKRQRNKLRLQRRRRELAREQRLKNKMKKRQIETEKLGGSKNKSDDMKQKVVLDEEFSMDDIDSKFLCAVCLDVLYDPHRVVPCNHSFCGPCLRRVGSKSPMSSFCPLCRQAIRICRPDLELSARAESEYPKLIAKREKTEANTDVSFLKLPWKPGWQNLIEGSPMGGNGFDTDGLGAIGIQIVSQIPFYFPGFLFGNMINLMFFLCLIGVVELIPLAVGAFFKIYLWILPIVNHQAPKSKFLRKINFGVPPDEVCLPGEEPPTDDQCSIHNGFEISGDYLYSLLMVILGTTTFAASSILFEAFPLFRRRGWPHRMFHEPIYNGFYFHEVVGIFWVCVLFFILSPKILHVPHSVGKLFNINRIQDNQLISQIITGLKGYACIGETLTEIITFYRICTFFLMYVSIVMVCDQRRLLLYSCHKIDMFGIPFFTRKVIHPLKYFKLD